MTPSLKIGSSSNTVEARMAAMAIGTAQGVDGRMMKPPSRTPSPPPTEKVNVVFISVENSPDCRINNVNLARGPYNWPNQKESCGANRNSGEDHTFQKKNLKSSYNICKIE